MGEPVNLQLLVLKPIVFQLSYWYIMFIFVQHKSKWLKVWFFISMICWLVWFGFMAYLTIVEYLMPNPVFSYLIDMICKHIL